MDGGGGSKRRSGRRMHEPLQHIGIGGPQPPRDDESEPSAEEPRDDVGYQAESSTESTPAPTEPHDEAEPAPRRIRTVRIEERRSDRPAVRRTGLDRIRPRGEAAGTAAQDEVAPATERDPLGRAALYSSGPKRPEPAFGTFLLECSACRRETPVTAGDLIRLGIPSLHLPFLRRFPSLMRCPACGRRTWLRIHWRI